MRPAAILLTLALPLAAQTPAPRPAFDAFEVATIKPTPPDWGNARFIRMTAPQRFYAPNYTTRALIAAAFSLSPPTILGGPAWLDSDHFDINAAAPGDSQPNLAEQMTMLRQLLTDRFKLTFHREEREFSALALSVARSGAKLKESAAPPEAEPYLISTIYPGDAIRLPARNATMTQLAAMMQRTIFDRPVLDRTGLTARYDFDLEWAPDEEQFDGTLKNVIPNSTKPSIFTALQEQLGLRLESTKGPVLAMIIDNIARPSEN